MLIGTVAVVSLRLSRGNKKFGLPIHTGFVVFDGMLARDGSSDSVCNDTMAIGRL